MTIPADAWGFIGVLAAFKLFTVGLILWFAVPWDNSAGFVWIHTAPQIVFVLLIAAAPGLYWYRLIRVRARRQRLIDAEFRVD